MRRPIPDFHLLILESVFCVMLVLAILLLLAGTIQAGALR